MNYHVLINKNAGGGKAGFFNKKIEAIFDENKISDYDIFLSDSIEDSKKYIKKIKNGILITAGGDGTINTALNLLIEAKKKIPLAHLAIGSGNDFTRSIGHLNWEEFLNAVLQKKISPTETNVGLMIDDKNKHYFINSFGIGFDAQVVIKSQDQKLKEKYKSLTYYVALLKVLKMKLSFDVSIDSKNLEKVFMLIVANNRFIGGGIEVSPESKLNENKLNVIAGMNYSLLNIIKIFTQIFTNKKHLENKNIYYEIKNKPFTIKRTKDMYTQIDGEIVKIKSDQIEVKQTEYQIFI